MTTDAHDAGAETGAEPRAYYVRTADPRTTGEGVRIADVRSTVHAQGAWRPEEMHMAAVSALLVHEIQAEFGKDGLRIARLSFEILGTLWSGDLHVETRVIRPGKTIELVESVLTARERAVLTCRAWLLTTTDTSAALNIPDELLTPREECAGEGALSGWGGGFIASLDGLEAPGHEPGHGRVWLTSDVAMVDGETTSDLVRLIGLADAANGIAPVLPPKPGGWFFPNVDLQIHLYRQPTGSWLGIANQVTVGPDGVGLTSSVLHDDGGPFAHAEQTLTVRPWPEA